MVKQKNPLRKRILREIVSDLGKYVTIFVLMVAMISLASGYFVAIGSMVKGYDESFELYNIENGHFTGKEELTAEQRERIEQEGYRIYPIFFTDAVIDNGRTLRMMTERKEVNKACLMSGRLAERPGEIALDATFAKNNQLALGDTVRSKNRSYEIVGLVSLSDYSALFSSNTDSMFDATLFGVSYIDEQDFSLESADAPIFRYAWKYEEEPSDEAEEKEMAEAFSGMLQDELYLEDFTPRYLNQAIRFAGDDLDNDSAMIHLFMYIMLLVLAFVFALTTADTVAKEAGVIGTLRASGYTKTELVIHYLSAPVLVTLLGCLIGNILGYTWLKQTMFNLYYNSYSLPAYPTLWNSQAFLETTITPLIIMFVISFLVLSKRLSLSPLKFLRRDLSKKKNRKALKLSHKLRFLTRYRLRVILQSLPNYLVLFFGLLLANILLIFGLALPVSLEHYEETITEDMIAPYQYLLSMPANLDPDSEELEDQMALLAFAEKVETDNETAEKFSAYSVYTHNAIRQEEVLIYGVKDQSLYIEEEIAHGDVWVSTACAKKFKAKIGDSIEVKEKYDDKVYSFKIAGIYPYNAAVAIFMKQDYMNQVFDLGDDYFSGYFAKTPIEDIDESYLGSVIDEESLTKVTRQLNLSFGGFMKAMRIATLVIFFVMMYLLTKIIIEKNAQSISMTKILGYTNREIQGLYLRATTIVVIIEMVICLPICAFAIRWMIEAYLAERMTGFLPCYLPAWIFLRMMAMGLGTYVVVALFEMIKIGRISKADALKNTE